MEIVSVQSPGFEPAAELAFEVQGAEDRPLEWNGISVSFNGVPAQLLAVRRNEIICLSPQSLSGTSVVAVLVRSGTSVSSDFMTAVRKRNFSFLPQVRNADGSLNSAENPAPYGSTIYLFVTGAGWPALQEATILTPGLSAAGSARVEPIPGFVQGLYQVALTAPPVRGLRALTITDPVSEPIDPWVWNATIPPPIPFYVQ